MGLFGFVKDVILLPVDIALDVTMITHRKELTGIADKVFEVSRKRVGDYWQSEVEEG